MTDLSHPEDQIQYVTNFAGLVSVPFGGAKNACCWARTLTGDFAEIVKKIDVTENITALDPQELLGLQLSEQGQAARSILLNDLELLKANGAAPTLNIIKWYERDEDYPFISTDVYSFHVDRSPIPTDTFLCTYYGESSEIIPNSQAEQKILVPEIRDELRKLYQGPDAGFETFLSEHYFDLHYRAKPHARPISLGLGNMWRLAVDFPESKSLPCIHRAPTEKTGAFRLLLIC
jgi:hypothetical protein